MDGFHTILVLGFALVIGIISFIFLSQVQYPTFNRGARKAATAMSKQSPFNQWGKRLFSNLGWQHSSLFNRIQTNMRWCTLIDNPIALTPEGLLFQSCFYALLFSLAALYIHEAWAYALPFFGFYSPFLQLQSKARRIQRQVLRALPIYTTIIAAESDTGAAPVNAVIRASRLPISIGVLVRKELLALQQHNENIFTYQDEFGLHPGALRQRIQHWNVQDLSELMANIDSISKQGVDRSERLNDLAKTQNLKYQNHVDKAIKKLESSLQLPIGFFFLLPLIVSVLVPFLMGMSL